jgi:hypothetical protein
MAFLVAIGPVVPAVFVTMAIREGPGKAPLIARDGSFKADLHMGVRRLYDRRNVPRLELIT